MRVLTLTWEDWLEEMEDRGGVSDPVRALEAQVHQDVMGYELAANRLEYGEAVPLDSFASPGYARDAGMARIIAIRLSFMGARVDATTLNYGTAKQNNRVTVWRDGMEAIGESEMFGLAMCLAGVAYIREQGRLAVEKLIDETQEGE